MAKVFPRRFVSALSSHCNICHRVRAAVPLIINRGLKDKSPPGDQSHDHGPEQNESDPQELYIPSRVRKRLDNKGLSIKDLEMKMPKSESGRPSQSMSAESISDHLASALSTEWSATASTDTESRLDRFPSDYTKSITTNKRYRTPKLPTEKLSVVLFPGQGSQFVGMGKQLLKYPGVVDLYEEASSVLGYDLLKVCLNGPSDKLMQTLYCQPAIFVTSVAALQKMKEEHLVAYENIVAGAGYSVGEFAALVASGAMSFEDGVEVIKLRAAAMEAAAKQSDGGMLSVFLQQNNQLRTAIVAAKDYCYEKLKIEEPVCNIAAYLTIGVRVVAGHEQALAFLQQYGREFGIKRTKQLSVSGAFHTELMNIGGRDYWQFVERLEAVNFSPPSFPLYLNAEGKQFEFDETREDWQRTLARLMHRQIKRPIKWEQTIQNLFKRPKEMEFPQIFEVGPGNQLGALLKMVNAKAHRTYRNIEV